MLVSMATLLLSILGKKPKNDNLGAIFTHRLIKLSQRNLAHRSINTIVEKTLNVEVRSLGI